MQKMLLLSLLIAPIFIPARASKDPNPNAGLKKAMVRTLYFNLFFIVALVFIYPRL